MVFKRRDKRPLWRVLVELIYPRGGWKRAFLYVRHRLHRLPDAPHRIARGIFAGVLVSFSPLFGLHIVIAALLARLMRGNVIAALLATLVGNPLTFPFIATLNLKIGHWMLGQGGAGSTDEGLWQNFAGAGRDLKHNFLALFNGNQAHWAHLHMFYNDVFLPYLIGGIVPGIVAALAAYYISAPVIGAYQKRRKGRLKKKLAELRQKAAKKPGGIHPPG